MSGNILLILDGPNSERKNRYLDRLQFEALCEVCKTEPGWGIAFWRSSDGWNPAVLRHVRRAERDALDEVAEA
jgi:hypothetical protein